MKSFYTNGTILTMEDHALYAEAVCVEHGRIKAVGAARDVLKLQEDGDEVIDLNGAVLMPGFIDAHSHFVGAANAMTQCDLSLCKDFAEIIELMRDFKEKRICRKIHGSSDVIMTRTSQRGNIRIKPCWIRSAKRIRFS